jgi:DNA-binding transcriptional LysR family regulator
MNWDDLRTALAIRDGGTMSAAARALGVNQTTVARRLERLERMLGVRLFDRQDGRMLPTAAGRGALERAAPMAEVAATVAAGVRDADQALSGAVRVTSLPSFVTGFIAPRLAGFTGPNPGITVELVGASENLHLGRREADLAVRFSRPTAGTMLARRIGTVGYAAYAKPAAFPEAAAGPLDRLPWAHYDEAFGHLPEQRWLDERVRLARRAATASDGLGLLALARHGVAAAVLPCFLGDAADGLVRLTGPEPVVRREIWLLSHPDLRAVRRVTAFGDWLRATTATARAALDGTIPAGEG